MNLKSKFREWLLEPEEREAIERIEQLEETARTWESIQDSLEEAVEHNGDLDIEKADVLIITGHNHLIRGVEFDQINLANSNHAIVAENYQKQYPWR